MNTLDYKNKKNKKTKKLEVNTFNTKAQPMISM